MRREVDSPSLLLSGVLSSNPSAAQQRGSRALSPLISPSELRSSAAPERFLPFFQV